MSKISNLDRWRGEETGEGVVELYSGKKLFTMKFLGPEVKILEATFGGDTVKDCTFTGLKVALEARSISILLNSG